MDWLNVKPNLTKQNIIKLYTMIIECLAFKPNLT